MQPPGQQPRYIQQQQPPPQILHQVQVQQGQYHQQQQQQFHHQQQQQEFQQPQRIVQQAVQELPRPESQTETQPPYPGQVSSSGADYTNMPPYPSQLSISGAEHAQMPPYLGQVSSSGPDNTHMPPPPPHSIAGVKRQSPGLSPLAAPEPRKKLKGAQEDEDDDQDVPSSMASQVKEVRKYSFNQYSGGPQLYTAPTPTGLTQYGEGVSVSGAGEYSQYGVAQTGLGPEYTGYQEQQYQNQEQQNRYGASPQHNVYGSQAGAGPGFTQFSAVSSAATYSTNVSSPHPHLSQFPRPLPHRLCTRTPTTGAGHSRGRDLIPKFVQMGTNGREELLSQPPPPPPRTGYW
ncbi:hypothetical protein DPMN_111152 [Dreissena polymorpha]|uniref:Uncharacterized protein n=2 Tax=Dreissena polymorpha TaxID=45954 RepID=A0A9D4QNJ6_DREPO|nr:hypothetical protein DPMN_111152 [Dreissena polymorpha]